MAETARKRFDRMIHRWRRLELDNACRVNPNLYRWWLDLDNACHVNPILYRWWLYLDNACHVNPNLHRWRLYLDNACHVNPNLYRWWLYLVYVGRLYQADNSKRRVRRLTHQFGTEWQNYINLILLKDNDKWRRNNITFVTNLFPYFLNPFFPLPKWPHAQNPCPIRLSAGGGGG